jgi:hypothetical protein
MRSETELQQAHDILIAIRLGEVPIALAVGDNMALRCALDVLCWVLDHDHNKAFAANLANLNAAAFAKGFHLVFRPPDPQSAAYITTNADLRPWRRMGFQAADRAFDAMLTQAGNAGVFFTQAQQEHARLACLVAASQMGRLLAEAEDVGEILDDIRKDSAE